MSPKYWPFLLLAIPCFMAFLGCENKGFIYQAGPAGCGILFLLSFCRKGLLPAKDTCFVMLAFALSIAGDWYLTTRNGSLPRFLISILLYSMAHGCYLIFSLMNGHFRWKITTALTAAFLVFYFINLNPSIHSPALKIGVIIYTIMSCVSLGGAIGTRLAPSVKWLYVAGIAMLVISDSLVGLKEFASCQKVHLLILPNYYLGQICITAAVLCKNLFSQGKSSFLNN